MTESWKTQVNNILKDYVQTIPLTRSEVLLINKLRDNIINGGYSLGDYGFGDLNQSERLLIQDVIDYVNRIGLKEES